MNLAIKRLSRFYIWLTTFYPQGFRQDYASEMQAVFHEKLAATSEAGKWALWHVFWKEVCDWPGAVLTEYWFSFRNTFGRAACL